MDTETAVVYLPDTIVEHYLYGRLAPSVRHFKCLSDRIVDAIESWKGWKVTIVAAPTRDLPLWRIKVRFQGGEPKLYTYNSASDAVKAWSV